MTLAMLAISYLIALYANDVQHTGKTHNYVKHAIDTSQCHLNVGLVVLTSHQEEHCLDISKLIQSTYNKMIY